MSIPKSSQKRLLRLVSARADMEYSTEAFRLFQAAWGTPADYHFFLSMVVCYCRPFTQGRGIGSILCEYPDYPDFPDPEMNTRHQRMMDIRHNFSSHSSIEGTRAYLLAPQSLHPATRGFKKIFITRSRSGTFNIQNMHRGFTTLSTSLQCNWTRTFA